MAFVLTQPVSSIRGSDLRIRASALLHAGRRAAERWRSRYVLTPQQRANLYVYRTPPAVLAASLGGQPS